MGGAGGVRVARAGGRAGGSARGPAGGAGGRGEQVRRVGRCEGGTGEGVEGGVRGAGRRRCGGGGLVWCPKGVEGKGEALGNSGQMGQV